MFSSVVANELCDKGTLVAAFFVIVWQWRGTLLLATVDVVSLLRRSCAVLMRSRQLALIGAALAVAVLSLIQCFSVRTWIAFPFAVLGISLLVASTILLPPSIMILGVSRAAETQWFVRSLAWQIAPLRIVHFLIPSGLVAADPLFFLSNARVEAPYRWQDSIHTVGSFIPFILIDSHAPTDSLEEEAVAAIEPQLIEKSVFIGTEDSPVLKSIAAKLDIELPALRLASSAQATRWMTKLRWEAFRNDSVRRGTPADRILVSTRRKVNRKTRTICEELRKRLTESPALTAEDICVHVQKCNICQLGPLPRSVTSIQTDQKVDPAKIPSTVMLGIDRFIDWEIFRKLATDPSTDLIVLSGDSPGARHPSWCVDVVKLFALDPQLGLVIEKDAIQPVDPNPVVAVRRALIEAWEPPALLLHLSEVARALAPRVEASGYKVRYEPLVEMPRGEMSRIEHEHFQGRR